MTDAPESVQSTLAYQDNDIAHEPPEALSEHPVNSEIYADDGLGDEFVESIEQNGVLEPLVITSGKKLISGHRRRQAAEKVDLDSVPVRYVEFEDEADEVLALIDFNRQREKTKGEKIREGKKVLEAKKRQNRENNVEAGKRFGQGNEAEQEGSPHGENPNDSDSYDEAAEKVDLSRNSLNRGVEVLDAAQNEDDDDVREVAETEMERLDSNDQSFRGASRNVQAARDLRELADSDDEIEVEVAEKHLQKVKDGKDAHKALRETKKHIEKRKHERELSGQEPELDADSEFDVIVADPPWDYNNDEYRTTHEGTVPYPTMSLEELKEIDIPAADDCILWLWFTNAFVQEASELVEAWGFEQKTILTWDKDWLGLGNWLQNQTEHAMLCVRGSPTADMAGESTVMRCQRENREHSKKPEQFYELVDRTCPGKKLELFSRQARNGWAAFGDEVETDLSDNENSAEITGDD